MSDDGLTFNALRRRNLERQCIYTSHNDTRVSDWRLGQWCNALTGELGEAANIIKKIERGDFSLDDARDSLADELADIMTYLDLLAFHAGINLGEATIKKWNKVSERIGSQLRIP